MGSMIDFKRPDGQTSTGYLAEAENPKGNVVVLQEWWGLNDQIKKTADRFAAAGYTALVPDLYRGRLASNEDEASHMMNGLDWADAAQQDLRGAAMHLKHLGGKTAVVGFCMGGALTIIAGVHVPECDAAVCYYGIPPKEAADPAAMKVPFLAHFATQDDWCTPEAVTQLGHDMEGLRTPVDIHEYEGHHAFFNEARPEVFNRNAAELSWDRTLAFLERQL